MVDPIKYRALRSPVAVQLELTPKCNNLCVYCYNAWRGNAKVESELSLDKHLQIADKLIGGEVFEIVLTGGEPLLRRDLVYHLAKKYSSKGIEVSLNTNLVMINKQDCLEIPSSGFSGILGSLPSHKEESYNQITQTKNYQRAIKGMELLVKAEIPLAINMVIIQSNKNQVYDTGKFLYGMGIKAFCATPASPSKFLKQKEELSIQDITKTLDDLLKLKDEFGMSVDIVEPLPRCLFLDPSKYEHFLKRDCGAGKTTVVVSSSGNIRPCTHVPVEYGNILEERLKVSWERMQEWRDGSFTPEECSMCKEVPICSLGCRESSKLKGNEYNHLDPWSNPNKVGSRRPSFDRVKVEKHEVYCVQPNIRYREEDDLKKLVFEPQSRSIALLNEDFFSFFLELNKRKTFCVGEIEAEFGDSSLKLINYLKSKNLIKLQEDKYGKNNR